MYCCWIEFGYHFHAIKCGVKTYPAYGASCSESDLFKIVAKGSLETLAYITAFLNIEREIYKNLFKKCVTISPGLP